MIEASHLRAASEALARASIGFVRTDVALQHGLSLLTRQSSELTGWWKGPRGQRLAHAMSTSVIGFAPGTLAAVHLARELTQLAATASQLAMVVDRLQAERGHTSEQLRRAYGLLTSAEDSDSTWSRINTYQRRIQRLGAELEHVGQQWHDECMRSARRIREHTEVLGAAASGPSPSDFGLSGTGVAALHAVRLRRLIDSAKSQERFGAASTSPDEVARWWGELPNDTQRWMLDQYPAELGKLDGIPMECRIQANRTHMQRLLDAESDPNGPLHRRMRQFLDPGHLVFGKSVIDPRRRFVVFDPDGDGKVAELFGDLSRAPNVAVVVPGMGSTLENFHGGVRENAYKLWQKDQSSAVIAWTGYDAPAGLEKGVRAREVASDGQAEVGGSLLARFVTGLRHESRADLTVIGHSYGSLVVGKALVAGMTTKRVVFIGSPGTGKKSVRQFPPGAAEEYFAAEVPGDPVATLERFGEAPTDPDFGAFVFDAGRPDSLDPIARHSEYFDKGTALDNLAAIVNGRRPAPRGFSVVERVMETAEDLSAPLMFSPGERFRVQVQSVVVEGVGHYGEQALRETGAAAIEALEQGADAAKRAASAAADNIAGGARNIFNKLTKWN